MTVRVRPFASPTGLDAGESVAQSAEDRITHRLLQEMALTRSLPVQGVLVGCWEGGGMVFPKPEETRTKIAYTTFLTRLRERIQNRWVPGWRPVSPVST